MGSQYRLQVSDQEYFLDLLLYHRGLQCLVALELKIGAFLPEYVGKMQFYLAVLDDTVKTAGENPSIGIILCKTKDRMIVEYALRESNKPIGVGSYKMVTSLPAELLGQLPTPEQIAAFAGGGGLRERERWNAHHEILRLHAGTLPVQRLDLGTLLPRPAGLPAPADAVLSAPARPRPPDVRGAVRQPARHLAHGRGHPAAPRPRDHLPQPEVFAGGRQPRHSRLGAALPHRRQHGHGQTGGDAWPVVKILRQPLGRAHGPRLQVGDRLPTVALYQNLKPTAPYWSDFFPTAVACLTDDADAVREAMRRLEVNEFGPDHWERLAENLALVPKPYKPGLYWMRQR